MARTGRYHGGLVFLGNEEGVLDRFSRIVTATLEDYGHAVERQTLLSDREARIVSSQFLVKLTLETNIDGDSHIRRMDETAGLNRRGHQVKQYNRNRLVVSMMPVSDMIDDKDVTELMLVVMLYRMVDLYTSELIEWLDPNVRLTVEQFLGAFSNVSPRRVRGPQQVFFDHGDRFAPIDETAPDLAMRYDMIMGRKAHEGEIGLVELTEQEALALAFRSEPRPDEYDGLSSEESAQNDIRRLASWGMTGCLAFVSAPIAVSLAAVNLIRGEDFRLNTQVLSLTAALVFMQSSGMLTSVISLLPI
ncbi:hypothetical protein [Ruegeria marina]|uniref:Uncharacterized protein n=1 Tax=Ruegeria marina TaxID=639004 RepID=A0A1G6QJ64_9RHOB|nr:hypothetical protein [Ruegeria marina]SDC91717.1 hypothetical protein SAMN04488239_104126 [Ruegeria marina]